MTEFGPPAVISFVNDTMNICRRCLEAGDPWKARLAAASTALHCHSVLQEPLADLSGDDKSAVLLLGILAAAYRDFADCFEFLKKRAPKHKEIEQLWTRLLDCEERIEAVQGLLGGPGLDWLKTQASGAYDHFIKRFGPGDYFFSPVIIVKRESCSICGEDLRACAHRAGVIYDGKRCRSVLEDIELRSCDLVRVPRDRRCRLWPWNFDAQTKQFSAAVFTMFDVDDLTDPLERAKTERSSPSPSANPTPI